MSITFNPAVLSVRSVQEGSFMRQGGSTAAFTQQVDAGDGRVDIASRATGDQAGAAGTGLLAAVMFDTVAAGTSTVAPTGVATAGGGTAALQFSASHRHGEVTGPARRCRRERCESGRSERGYTFVELLVVTAILLILASAVHAAGARDDAARSARSSCAARCARCATAIDSYKDAADTQPDSDASSCKPGSEGYPPDLETLVEGRDGGQRRVRAKLQVPAPHPDRSDDRSDEWGLRSYQDKPDSTRWGGQNVFDVFTKSEGTALDGTKYRDW